MLKDKVEIACDIINMVNKEYKNPIIYSGIGKDSLPLIHLCHNVVGVKWDIMFHRDPYFPHKYRFSNKIIDKWNLICRDYPARSCSIFYLNNVFEVVREFQVGYSNLALCALLYKPDRYLDGEYLCALKDIYLQPKGSYDYSWDAGLLAHRYSEKKPHRGGEQNMLRWQHKHNIGSADFAYPMWNWTDEDIYQYHVENEIPINFDVYDVVDGKIVPKIDPETGQIDSTYNPDRRPACFECMLPDNPGTVFCPKKMCFVNNVYENLVLTLMPTDFTSTCPTTMYPEKFGGNDNGLASS